MSKAKNNQLKQVLDLGKEIELYGQISVNDETDSMEFEDSEVAFSETKLSNFSFNIEKSMVDFIRDFVLEKRENPKYYHYNNSDAMRDGISLLRESNSKIKRRPSNALLPTKRGTLGRLNGITKVKTSFSISDRDKDFLYNYIYFKQQKKEDFGKADFFEDLVKALKGEDLNEKRPRKAKS